MKSTQRAGWPDWTPQDATNWLQSWLHPTSWAAIEMAWVHSETRLYDPQDPQGISKLALVQFCCCCLFMELERWIWSSGLCFMDGVWSGVWLWSSLPLYCGWQIDSSNRDCLSLVQRSRPNQLGCNKGGLITVTTPQAKLVESWLPVSSSEPTQPTGLQ